MGLLKKLHDKLFEDTERVPPPPAPGMHAPSMQNPPPPSEHPAFSAPKNTPPPTSTPPAIPQYAPKPFLEGEKEVVNKEVPPQEVPFPSDPMIKAHSTQPPKGLPEVPGLTARTATPPPPVVVEENDIKEHPAHDTPFFSQKPVIKDDKPVTPVQLEKSVAQPPKAAAPQEVAQPQAPINSAPKVVDPVEESAETHWEQPPTFHLSDGRVVAGPTSLAFIADDMSDEVFSHHVTSDRNDFATWIANGLGDESLAEKVRGASTPKELATVLRGHHGASVKSVSSEPLPKLSSGDDKPTIDVSSLKESFDAITVELERAASMKEDIQAQQASLEERENSLLSREKKFSEVLASFEQEQQQTRKALKETARLRDELRKRHVELAELALSLDAERDRLRVSRERAQNAPQERSLSHDVREDSFAQVASAPVVSAPAADVHSVLDVVERAHRALVDKHVSEARSLYSQARELFYQANIPEAERRELYNLIRELYTDIELTRIS